MALSNYKLTSFTNPVASLDDKPQMSAADLKAKFDANSEELKTKVNGLIDELTDELGDKVDAVNGKGLSTNDYTTEEKTKLAEIDTSKEHTHTNKAILDDITVAPIADAPSDNKQYARKNGTWAECLSGLPTVALEDIDNLCNESVDPAENPVDTVSGVYKVTNTSIEVYDVYDSVPMLLIVDVVYMDSHYTTTTTQTQITPSGVFKTRTREWYGATSEEHDAGFSDWSNWQEVGHIINTSIGTTTDGAETTFTFATNQRYKLERTTTDAKMLSFNTPATTSYVNEIEIYMTVEANESVLWGSNVIFVDSEIPTLTTGKYYRVIAEFDPIADKWCVGVIESGASA